MAKGGPDLKRYMDKTLSLKLNGNRIIKVSAAVSACYRVVAHALSVRVSHTPSTCSFVFPETRPSGLWLNGAL